MVLESVGAIPPQKTADEDDEVDGRQLCRLLTSELHIANKTIDNSTVLEA